jgi:hypothetical protein
MTKEELKDFGMVEQDDPIYPMAKDLSEESEEGEKIAIVITRERNSAELALILPGGTLFLGGVKSVEDLKTIEACVTEWEPSFS